VFLQAGVLKPAVASLSYVLAAADFSDWPSAARPFALLLSFSTNARPKVRKRAHDGMVQVLVALQQSPSLQPASAAVLQGELLASMTP
jgi:ribosomal RNA-processing protein 12